MLPQAFSNPAAAVPVANVITVDGSLGDVFVNAITANSTIIVKNVDPGKTVRLITVADNTRTVTPDGAPVQTITMSGGAAAFTCKAATQCFKITGLTATTCFMSMSWDGLYA